jgi:hypothetical protein
MVQHTLKEGSQNGKGHAARGLFCCDFTVEFEQRLLIHNSQPKRLFGLFLTCLKEFWKVNHIEIAIF